LIHSLTGETLEILVVSKWWKLDPDVVEQWSMPDFLDRREYMHLQLEMTPRDPDLAPGERDYNGPKGQPW
jgi:hypothetical protein